jgi:tRNA(Ile)-lysidine synthase
MQIGSLDERLLQAVEQSLQQHHTATVALSGGLDSVVLLHLCSRLRSKNTHLCLNAVHINHRLSDNAVHWQQHCIKLCADMNIDIMCRNVSVSTQNRTSLEEQARAARYHAIADAVSDNSVVVLAQHQDDQAETFLLQLARGAGPKGLSAMPKDSKQNYPVRYIRPLLDFTRAQLSEYAQQYKLVWVEDESNQNTRFARNFVRHEVMPGLRGRWPSITESIARSAQHCADYVELAEQYVALLADKQIDAQGRLNLTLFNDSSKAEQNMLLRHFLQAHGEQAPSTAIIQQIKQIVSAKSDAQGECQWQGNVIRRYKDRLYVLNASMLSDDHTPYEALEIKPTEQTLYRHAILPYYIAFIAPADAVVGESSILIPITDKPLRIDFGGFQRVCKLDEKRPRKAIKSYLQEWEIPPWERAKVPILSQEGKILAVGLQPAVVKPDTTSGTKKPTFAYIELVGLNS